MRTGRALWSLLLLAALTGVIGSLHETLWARPGDVSHHAGIYSVKNNVLFTFSGKRQPSAQSPPPAAAPRGLFDVEKAALWRVPYQVAVWSSRRDLLGGTTHDFLCAGALVMDNLVLTTASCANSVAGPAAALSVSAGHLGRRDRGIEYLCVSTVAKHRQYDAISGANNIAMLKVSPAFSPSSNVRVVSLPLAAKNKMSEGTLCTISGWRQDVIRVDYFLNVGQVLTFNSSTCTYRDCHLGDRLRAGIPKWAPFSCLLGDDGGPLVCEGELLGLLSYSPDPCLRSNTPGSYVDVFYHREWIADNIVRLSREVDTTECVLPPVGTTKPTWPTVGTTEPTWLTVGTTEHELSTIGTTKPTLPTVGTTTEHTPPTGTTEPTLSTGGSSGSTLPTAAEGSTTGVLDSHGGSNAVIALLPLTLIIALINLCK